MANYVKLMCKEKVSKKLANFARIICSHLVAKSEKKKKNKKEVHPVEQSEMVG